MLALLFSEFIQRALYRTILGCLSFFVNKQDFLILIMCSISHRLILTAQTFPEERWMHLCTTPLDPSPNFFTSLYLSSKLSGSSLSLSARLSFESFKLLVFTVSPSSSELERFFFSSLSLNSRHFRELIVSFIFSFISFIL